MNLNFREWMENNYYDLDNMYYDLMNYKKNVLQKDKFLDHLSKEDFFIFIYQNTRHRF
jgi:hypothetical protein